MANDQPVNKDGSRTDDRGIKTVRNRTLCLKDANRHKTNRNSWKAWGNTQQSDAKSGNFKNLPANKAWRFALDAMVQFEGETDFSARALKDTQYLARIARAYLDALYDGQDSKSHGWVVSGHMSTAITYLSGYRLM